MRAIKRHIQLHRRRGIGLAAAICCLLAAGGTAAQIVTDASLGSAGQRLSGPAYTIPQSLGKLAGSNLFHSFQSFNIGAGESATFTTATPGVSNVISRVSGGAASLINGRLSLVAADGAPGFYFINPAGVTFGAGAVVDVPGALHVGTADHVVFADGRFNADTTKTSSFSSAAPQAFGFLGSSRAPIKLHDGAEVILPRGPAISLAAGDVTIANATVGLGAGSLRISAVGGEAAEIGFDGAFQSVGGELKLDNRAALISASRGASVGPSVTLNGGRIEIGGEAGVASLVAAGNSGPGGAIDVRARDVLLITGGGNISSNTAGGGAAGAIGIRAGDVQLDSTGYLFSSASPGSTGNSGAIVVISERGLRLDTGASISTATAGGGGSGGGVHLQAAEMLVDRQAFVQTDAFSERAPGGIVLDIAGGLVMANRGRVATATSASADAGLLDLRLGRLTMDSESFIGSLSLPGAGGRSGLVDIKLAGDASLSGGASLLASSASAGDAAPVRLSAVNLRLDNAAINSNATGNAAGASGNVELRLSGDLILLDASAIDTSTLSGGRAGTILVRARDITLDADSRIASSALDGSGSAGALDLQAGGRLQLQRESALSTTTSTSGNAGEIRVGAAVILLDSSARISSTAGQGSSGSGGNVFVTAAGELLLRQAATIVANTAGSGNAGNVSLAAGYVMLDGGAFVSTSTTAGSSGNAGRIEIATSGDIKLSNSAFISSDTQGRGNAGLVDLRPRNLTLESDSRISSVAGTGSGGDAGLIDILASGDVSLLNASQQTNQSPQISTSTFSRGTGGEIRIRAANLLIDGAGAGIVSFAQTGSSGNAGSISVAATGDVVIRSGALSSSTDAAGAGGRVQVQAVNVLIDGSTSGLTAKAGASSAGQAGNVVVDASESIRVSAGGFVTIDNAATVADPASRQATTVRLAAPVILLRDLAFVSAESSGNVAASDIVLDAPSSLTLNRSAISTSANAGNGGSIEVSTTGIALLRDSLIRTSVFGPQGNGGDIRLSAGTLLLDSGFVQANTAARNATGGLVRINAGALVTSGSSLFLAGNTPFEPKAGVFGFNVIQAAAPTGISGDVRLASPALDVTGSLRELRAEAVDAGGLGRSLCQNSGGSALALAGRGGLAPTAGGLLRAESIPAMSDLASSSGEPRPARLGDAIAAGDAWGCR